MHLFTISDVSEARRASIVHNLLRPYSDQISATPRRLYAPLIPIRVIPFQEVVHGPPCHQLIAPGPARTVVHTATYWRVSQVAEIERNSCRRPMGLRKFVQEFVDVLHCLAVAETVLMEPPLAVIAPALDVEIGRVKQAASVRARVVYLR